MEKHESLKRHWEGVYNSKAQKEMSWYQPFPIVSMELINDLHLQKNAAFVDVGGGDGFLVDVLIETGFSDISILDISERALFNAKNRLGPKQKGIHWLNENVLEWDTEKQFDLWHDRAVFHFLKKEDEISRYVVQAAGAIKKEGHLIVGTFSMNGPKVCSGLDVHQYSIETMRRIFEKYFNLGKHLIQEHQTPSGKIQEFLFAVWQRK